MTLPNTLPEPRTPEPMAAPPLRWGIAGPGWIAARFAAALRKGTRQELVAVASRDAGRARAFADRWSIPAAHEGVEAMAADPPVDVVYVATPTTTTDPPRSPPSRAASTRWSRSRSRSTRGRARGSATLPERAACG